MPVALPQILGDLKKIADGTEAVGTAFAIGSFVWMAYEGMLLDRSNQPFFYTYLNRRFWPLSYGDIRRYADYENRVFKSFAETTGSIYIPIAEAFPRDPALMTDGVHMSPEGVRLRGWIVFNALAPLIEKRIAAGAWPRSDQESLAKHPAFDPVAVEPLSCVLERNEAGILTPRLATESEAARLVNPRWAPIGADEITTLYDPATLAEGRLVVNGATEAPYGYLAVFDEMTMAGATPQGIGLKGELAVGGVTVGLQMNDAWVVTKNITRPGPFEAVWNLKAEGTYRIVVANFLAGSETMRNDLVITGRLAPSPSVD